MINKQTKILIKKFRQCVTSIYRYFERVDGYFPKRTFVTILSFILYDFRYSCRYKSQINSTYLSTGKTQMDFTIFLKNFESLQALYQFNC